MLALLLILCAAGASLWLSRERIATDLIDDYLTQAELAATYDITSIGVQQQVITNLVVGDPAAPDLTIERVVVDVRYGLGAPAIASVSLDRPRLYATLRDGALSFGALDPIVFGQEGEAGAELPALDVTIRKGGARLATDYGAVGASFEGAGALDDGFAGKLAVLAPQFGVAGCAAQRLTAYGDLSIKSGVPRFEGPVRLRNLACEGIELVSADIGTALSTTKDFAKVEGTLDLATGALLYDGNRTESVAGRATLSLDRGALILGHDVTLAQVRSAYVTAASLRTDGTLRSRRGFSDNSWNAQITGADIAVSNAVDGALVDTRTASQGTMIAPLLGRLQDGLNEATKAATLDANVIGRMAGGALSLVVPEARMRSAGGDTILAVSRASWSRAEGKDEPRLVGNFLTGGAQLPLITGRIEQAEAGLTARFSVAPYGAGRDQIAVPNFNVRSLGEGRFAFAGQIRASGAIPGGSIDRLEMPVSGRFDPGSGLRAGMDCETVRFAAVTTYDLALDARALRLCPGKTGAIVAYNDALLLDAVSEKLVLTGNIAGSPLDIAAAQVQLSYPGGFELTDISAQIGARDAALRFNSARVSGGLDGDMGGDFAGAAAALDLVPLDLDDLAGRWSYTGDILRIKDARFILSERSQNGSDPRFNPLGAQGASLTLDGSDIRAHALLQHPASGTAITSVAIAHDLSTARGSAALGVDGLTFGPALSVQDLSELARGVIAYTDGTVTGEGRIAWNADTITSSAVFRSDDLDLAAAFGPVSGLKGEVRFSDLLNLTTEPSQLIEIGSINPGIEALAGKVRFSLTNGEIVELEDARWPFMGGELIMRPTTLRYGTDQDQRYTFEVIALDAATFVAQMELGNIGATGTFDGTIPIVFDAKGNGRIEQGLLISRTGGGNVSYVGELTYEDMGAISNYAFQSLRSLDYRQMSVGLDGDLAGEIITRFQFDGVRQGADARQNFITRRLAKLPIRFLINVRSENFYELATMVRTFWDPDALPDAIDQGLISADQMRARAIASDGPEPPDSPETSGTTTEAMRPDEPRVQPPESETMP